MCSYSLFFNDTATTDIYTLSLHDALPISCGNKCGAPAETKGDPRNDDRSNNGTHVRARVEDACSQRALTLWEPVGHSLDCRWEVASFTQAEKEARYAEPNSRTG